MPDDYERFLRQHVIDSNRRNAKNTWTLCQGDDQTEYYFNEYTRAISWDKPADYVEPTVNVQPIIDEHSNVQQVRGHEYSTRQAKSEQKPQKIPDKTQTTNNIRSFGVWVVICIAKID